MRVKTISQEVTFQLTLDGRCSVGQLKNVPGRKKSTCKGHEAGKVSPMRIMLTVGAVREADLRGREYRVS